MNLDMANAFASTSWQCLAEQTPLLFDEEDHWFATKRYDWDSVELPCSETSFLVPPQGTGALMGDQYAMQSFLSAYDFPTNTWIFCTPTINHWNVQLSLTVKRPLFLVRWLTSA